MKLLGLSLIVLGLSLSTVAQVSAQGSTTFALKGHADGASYYWTEGSGTAKNPTLEVPANAVVTVTATSASGDHNLKIGTGATSDTFSTGDPAVTMTFTAPASGDVKYICTLHGDAMSGNFHVAGSASTEPTKKSPGTQLVGVSIALVGAALLLRRK